MQNDINIDFTDYQTILAHKGKIVGRVGDCKSADFMTNLDEEFKTSLGDAKGVLLEFEQNKNANLSQISSIMEELNEYFEENADVIFGVKQNDTVKFDTIGYKIIATGIPL
jgi:cell division GTPase FtsZ